MKFRDFESSVDSKDLGRIVAKSLMKQYHSRKMIDVSKFHYNLHMAWRGVNTFIWKRALKLFCRPLARELKIGKKLKKELFDTPSVNKNLGFVAAPSSLSYQKENSSAKDEKSDEGSDEISFEEESDENVKKKKHSSKSPEGRKNLDSLFK